MTSDELRNKEFTITRKGYSQEEVRAFLDSVADAWEERMAELEKIEQGLAGLEKEIESFETVRDSLSECLEAANEKIATYRSRAKMAERHAREAEQRALAAEEKAEDAIREVRAELEAERDEMLRQAREEVNLVLQEAAKRGKMYIRKSREKADRMHEHLALLQSQRLLLIARLKSLLLASVQFIEDLESDPVLARHVVGQQTEANPKAGLSARELESIIQTLDILKEKMP
ncbi:MAG: DivIVA domain-containing protein [Chlorobi bacterium]|nr:DivIVA domain-containing protein [Chlorobiota bacterium]